MSWRWFFCGLCPGGPLGSSGAKLRISRPSRGHPLSPRIAPRLGIVGRGMIHEVGRLVSIAREGLTGPVRGLDYIPRWGGTASIRADRAVRFFVPCRGAGSVGSAPWYRGSCIAGRFQVPRAPLVRMKSDWHSQPSPLPSRSVPGSVSRTTKEPTKTVPTSSDYRNQAIFSDSDESVLKCRHSGAEKIT